MVRWITGVVLVSLMVVGCSQNESSPGMFGQPASEVGPAPSQEQPRSAVIWIRNLSCPLCVQAVKRELGAVRGVEKIDINYEEELATITLASRKPPTREQILEAVERTGYVLTKLEMR